MSQSQLTPSQIRIGGIVAFLIGVAALVGTFIASRVTGKILTIGLVVGIVFIPGGIFMTATGKIPQKK